MQKRGQVEISFGMIFSIILIIVFLAVGFYAIKLFLHTSDEAKAGTLISDLQTDIDNVWRNPSSSVTKDYSMPSNADYICFVNFSYDDSGANSVFYQNIKDNAKLAGVVNTDMLTATVNALQGQTSAYTCSVGRDQLDRMLVQDIVISGTEAQPQIAVIAKCKLKDGSFRDMALTTWQIGKNADGKWRLRGATQ